MRAIQLVSPLQGEDQIRKEKENAMTNERDSSTQAYREGKRMKGNGVSSGVYGLAFIGAAVYFIEHAPSFWAGVLGLLKALVWPALLIYKLLEFLKM